MCVRVSVPRLMEKELAVICASICLPSIVSAKSVIPIFLLCDTGGILDSMYKWYTLVMHNANVVMMFMELFLNGMHFVAYHAVFAILYGCTNLVFQWYVGSPLASMWRRYLHKLLLSEEGLERGGKGSVYN